MHGTLKVDLDATVDRRLRRFMGDGAAYAYVAMKEAIAKRPKWSKKKTIKENVLANTKVKVREKPKAGDSEGLRRVRKVLYDRKLGGSMEAAFKDLGEKQQDRIANYIEDMEIDGFSTAQIDLYFHEWVANGKQPSQLPDKHEEERVMEEVD